MLSSKSNSTFTKNNTNWLKVHKENAGGNFLKEVPPCTSLRDIKKSIVGSIHESTENKRLSLIKNQPVGEGLAPPALFLNNVFSGWGLGGAQPLAVAKASGCLRRPSIRFFEVFF